MSFRSPVNRVIHSVVWCGVVGYVLTWLLHLFLKAFLRAASPLVIEGTVAAVCGGLLGSLFGLYFARAIVSAALRIFLCVCVVLLIPIIVVSAGIAGMMATERLTKLPAIEARLRANQNHDIIAVGYNLMPPLWTMVLIWGLCWYFNARRGVALLSCDRAASPYRIPDDQHSPDHQLRQLGGWIVLSCVVSWLVHCYVTSRIGWIWSSQSPIEGATTILSTASVVAVGVLYMRRAVKNRYAGIVSCALLALVVGAAFGFSGYFGYATATVVTRQAGANLSQAALLYGYYIFPPLWSCILSGILCWYYKATHGGSSLLNFDLSGRYDVESPQEPSHTA